VLAVLVLAASVALTVLAVQLRRAEATESAATNAQVTAPRYAERLLSYDHTHLERDFAAARRLLTDDFVREYTRATDEVRAQALRDRAVIEASVVASSVVHAEPDQVRTLLFVNQTTTTRSGPPSIDLNRVELTLVEEDGRWLVDDLAAL
jgi:Mce-associated membrane protein